MNAMEMMAKAALEKLLENIPPETLAQVRQIGQFVHTVDMRLARMEANQKAIMLHLGIVGLTGDAHATTGDIENAGNGRTQPHEPKQLGSG